MKFKDVIAKLRMFASKLPARNQPGNHNVSNTQNTPTQTNSPATIADRPVRPELYWIILGAWVFILLIAIRVSWIIDPTVFEIVTALMVIWIAMSIRIINFNRTIGLLGLEMPIANTRPGPKVIPWLLMRVLEYPADIQQRQFPGNPEEVFKGDDKDPLPERMYRPLRITTGTPDPKDTGILDIQATVEVLFYLRVRIVGALQFHLKYGDIEGFWSQMRDTGQTTLAEKFSRAKGLGALISQLPEIMETLNAEYKRDLADGGVDVVESGLDSPDLSKRLSEALRDLGVARSEGEQVRTKITQEGLGRAAAEAALITQTSEALKNASPAAQAAYVGSRVLGDKTTILGMDGIAAALTMIKTIGQSIDIKDQPKT